MEIARPEKRYCKKRGLQDKSTELQILNNEFIKGHFVDNPFYFYEKYVYLCYNKINPN